MFQTKYITISIVIYLWIISYAGEAVEMDDVNSNFTSKIQLLYNTSTCRMYSSDCKIHLLVTKDFDISYLSVKINDSKFFKFLRFVPCSSNETNLAFASECSKTVIPLQAPAKVNIENYTILYAVFEPIIIGGSFIEFAYNETNFYQFINVNLIITQPKRIKDLIFEKFVLVIQLLIAFFMGLLLDANAIMKIIQIPKPVLIGFLSQYICMPLISFAFLKIFSFTPVEALAIFIYGCCPGGAGSNNWTVIFDGDIDLSALMTFVSTLASLICTPLWLYTLGKVFTNAVVINIPFFSLLMNLLTTIGPCLVGLVITKTFPKIRPIALKIAKPLMLLVIFTLITLLIIVKTYVFTLIKWKQWLIAPFIPWSGFLIGAIIAKLTRLPLNQVITVGIETGIQNVGVAFLIIIYNFPSPESDYAILPLTSIALLTGVPLWIGLAVKLIYNGVKRLLKRKTATINEAILVQSDNKNEYLLEDATVREK